MLRCSPELGWTAVIPHLNHAMLRMQYSGYERQFKAQTLKSALKAYKEIVKKDADGSQPMYRDKNWKKDMREKNKRKKRSGWFRKGGYRSVLFIPSTPGSELKRRCENIIKASKTEIKIVEKCGRTLKQRLQKSDPLSDKKCADHQNCPVCASGDGGNCRAEGINYTITCKVCGAVYHGESSRNGYTRGLEHYRDYKNKTKNSIMWRHAMNDHGDDDTPPEFEMKVTDVRRYDATLRQVTEGVRISNTPTVLLINNKTEWNAGGGIVGSVLTRM